MVEAALLRRREVELITGLSRWTIARLVEEGTFPRPVRIGARMLAWRAREVFAWVDGLETT